jgi:hypothetical protein
MNFALMYVNCWLLPHDFNHTTIRAAQLKERVSFLGDAMKRLGFVTAIVWLFLPAAALAQSQQTTDVELIRGVNQQLAAAIEARDINAMDKVWAHETYASFIGPLSTMVVVGWDGVRKAWQMRFGQFDRVTISQDDPLIRVNGHAAWAVAWKGSNCCARTARLSASTPSLRMCSRTRVDIGSWSHTKRRRSQDARIIMCRAIS